MKVEQIKDIVNEITKEMLGESVILEDDLSNIVNVGTTILSTDTNKEQFMKTLTDRIAKVEIDSRIFASSAPSIYMDNYEFGSAREVIDFDIPEAEETQDWLLNDRQEYPDNIFYEPKAQAKFFNSATTFTVPISKTDEQLKTAFLNASEMYTFVSGIATSVRNSLTLKNDGLKRATVSSLMGDTIYDEFKNAEYTTKTGTRAINLLYEFNQNVEVPLTVSNCLKNTDFLKFCAKKISITANRIAMPSALFNLGGRVKQTTKDLMHTLMLSDFKSALDVYLNADTFHEEYVSLKNLGKVEEVGFWQGSGTNNFAFSDVSKIKIKTAEGHDVECSGILATIFDHYACGITQNTPTTTAHYVASANFTNEWNKQKCSFFQNTNNNAVVFFIA